MRPTPVPQILTSEQAVVAIEAIARTLISMVPAEDWVKTAQGASFKIMKLSNAPRSESGSYRITPDDIPDTVRPPSRVPPKRHSKPPSKR